MPKILTTWFMNDPLQNIQPLNSSDKDDNAKVMAEFAAAMMRAIKAYSDTEHNLQLRIGKNQLHLDLALANCGYISVL